MNENRYYGVRAESAISPRNRNILHKQPFDTLGDHRRILGWLYVIYVALFKS